MIEIISEIILRKIFFGGIFLDRKCSNVVAIVCAFKLDFDHDSTYF